MFIQCKNLISLYILPDQRRGKSASIYIYVCFVNVEKAFDKVLRKVMEWAMKKTGLPEVYVRAVMSFYL